MNKIEDVKKSILSKMKVVESKTGKLFHETHPELEERFWECVDHDSYSGLMFINESLSKIIDKEEV